MTLPGEMISTSLLSIVYTRQNDCLLCLRDAIWEGDSPPANLMHRVRFLPRTAPLAPADIYWMRKAQCEATCGCGSVGVLSPDGITAGLEPQTSSSETGTVPGVQTTGESAGVLLEDFCGRIMSQ